MSNFVKSRTGVTILLILGRKILKIAQVHEHKLDLNKRTRRRCSERHITNNRKISIWRYIASLVLLSILNLNTFSQSVNSPTKTQCKQWDDAYLATFNIAIMVLPFVVILCCIILPLFAGKITWLLTAPFNRILVITISWLALFFFFVVLWPRLFGFGNFLLSGTDPRYVNCVSVQFGAEGFFGGLLGRGVAAAGQFFLETVLLIGASIIGGLAAFLLSCISNRFFGLPSQVKGDSA